MNGTSPDAHGDTRYGWVESPNCGRGTLDIIWACFLTVILCCWSALRMNTPADRDSDIRIFSRRLKWMLVGIFAPEIISLTAIIDWFRARKLQHQFRKIEQLRTWTRVHAFLLVMGGISLKTPDGEVFRPLPDQFLKLVENHRIEMQEITKRDIEDKGKANVLVKIISLVQVLWFVSNTIGRAVLHLPITTLELSTCAIVLCTIPTIGFWWIKPCDLERPFVLKTTTNLQALRQELRNEGINVEESSRRRIPFISDQSRWGFGNVLVEQLVLVLLVAAFGPVHLLGWNFHFPTPLEQLLWRISSILCTCLPIVFQLLNFIWDNISDNFWERTLGVLVYATLFAYAVVRLYLLGEVFAGLRAVSAGIYMSLEWSNLIPHWGL